MAEEAAELATGTGTLVREETAPIKYQKEAVKFEPKKIHPRREIPLPPPGLERSDPHPSLQLSFPIEPSDTGARGRRALAVGPNDVVLVQNVELESVATHGTASNVGEPSVSSTGQVVFYTGNWYAAVSSNGGKTFKFVDPFNSFPDPDGMSFCCDQVVQYIPNIDTFVWLLQYTEKAGGGNIQRLAFAKTADVPKGRWQLYDISPDSLGLPKCFLDFPDLALGKNHLYVTTNVFQGSPWIATAIVRIPFSGILQGTITADHAVSRQNFNFRVAQHTGTRAYWASHQDTSTLRVFWWDEGTPQPSARDVAVATWNETDYSTPTPSQDDWLARADPRVTGATRAGDELWFGWGAGRGGANNRPHPYVQIARLGANDLRVTDNINLWDPGAAICYAALCSNTAGNEVATSYMTGGESLEPSHVVGFLTAPQRNMFAARGQRGPNDGQWGDYLTVRRHQPEGTLFAATGYTLKSEANANTATPRFVLFGRSKDVGSAAVATRAPRRRTGADV
jgi:hypothetical protein